MTTGCLFGFIVFAPNSTIIYRFLTDDLREHIVQGMKKKGLSCEENPPEEEQNDEQNELHEHRNSIDDDLPIYFNALLRVHDQALHRHDPIKHIKLETGLQVFYDQIAENTIICMSDSSFDAIVVLKTINLFKALIRFHIGALPFTSTNIGDQLIDRISSSLQYYLNHVKTNQALLFESCEHLIINSLIRKQCIDTCSIISNDIETLFNVPRKSIFITCLDKIVYEYQSEEQTAINHADVFLLLLNNTSRVGRKEFELQKRRSMAIAHRYRWKSNSTRTSTDSVRSGTNSGFTNTTDSNTSQNEREKIYQSELVFLKTADRVIAPFTLLTIPLVNQLSVLILIEWSISEDCAHLFTLVRQLDIYMSHGLFPYNRLNAHTKAIENSTIIRDYFDKRGLSISSLTDFINRAHDLHKSSEYINGDVNQKMRIGGRIIRIFQDMSTLSSDTFGYLFFDSDAYAPRLKNEVRDEQDVDAHMDGVYPNRRGRKNETDVSTITKLFQKNILPKLEDWFSFIEVKSQRNITMNFCLNDFPGLVHFVFIDRLHGQIFAPTLISDQSAFQTNDPSTNYTLEKKILAFEKECLSALHEGFTSYTVSDEHFIYNYTLRLQESNGASMRLHKPFTQTMLPSVLHVDFYKALAEEYYPSLTYQKSVSCFELISVHLRLVPANVVRTQCEQLWPKLMGPFE